MKLEVLDNITELQNTLKKESAILDSFMNEYVIGEQKTVALAIDSHFESFQYMAHVIADLLGEAKEQAEKLGELAEKNA